MWEHSHWQWEIYSRRRDGSSCRFLLNDFGRCRHRFNTPVLLLLLPRSRSFFLAAAAAAVAVALWPSTVADWTFSPPLLTWWDCWQIWHSAQLDFLLFRSLHPSLPSRLLLFWSWLWFVELDTFCFPLSRRLQVILFQPVNHVKCMAQLQAAMALQRRQVYCFIRCVCVCVCCLTRDVC